ncbi:MAG: HepT-like ribonuclease domain-containing protein [Candidatus Aminicenantales bacterium]
MPSDLKDAAPLWDMLDAARAILDFIQEKNAEDYFRDRMLRGAVERHLEIIGEAARRVSEPFQARHPEISWRRIIGLRNILAHEYGEIKHERIWDLVVQEIPELVRLLKVLVPSSD